MLFLLPVSWRHLLKTWRRTLLLPASQLHWRMLKMEPFFCVKWEKLLLPWKVCAFPFYLCFFSFNHTEQFCLWSGGINFHFQKDLKLAAWPLERDRHSSNWHSPNHLLLPRAFIISSSASQLFSLQESSQHCRTKWEPSCGLRWKLWGSWRRSPTSWTACSNGCAAWPISSPCSGGDSFSFICFSSSLKNFLK